MEEWRNGKIVVKKNERETIRMFENNLEIMKNSVEEITIKHKDFKNIRNFE